MRLALLSGLMLASCSTEPVATAPAPVGVRDPAEANLPDFRPDTVAACNAERLTVDLSREGTIGINGKPATLDQLKAAAAKKDVACRNAPAMVVLSSAAATPAALHDAIKLLLQQAIVNLTLVETSGS